MRARDVLTDETFDIRARCVVVTAGPWTSIAALAGRHPPLVAR